MGAPPTLADMEINGVPLHPLVVHAAVVFAPLAALAALAYAGVPRWREWLRWPLFVLAVVATGAILGAYFSGENLLDSRPQLGDIEAVRDHQEYAEKLYWTGIGFGIVTVLATLAHRRGGTLAGVLRVLSAAAAIGVLVLVVLTGDEGARAVWGG